jgi:uncharacterized Zn-finger protein
MVNQMSQNANSTISPEIIKVAADAYSVSCDGGGGAYGHPKVWYTFDGQNQVECGYCDRIFVKS